MTNIEITNDKAQLFEALAKAQGEFGVAVKTGHNPHFNSSFADKEELIRVTRPALVKHGLSITQGIVWIDGAQFIETELGHLSGQSKISLVKINSEKATLQSFGSAITYIERYAYKALLGIATRDEDDDGTAGNEIVQPAKVEIEYKEPIDVETRFIREDQLDQINDLLANYPEIKDTILMTYKIDSLNQIDRNKFYGILKRVTEMIKTLEMK